MKPVIDLLTDMLVIDVYFYCVIIRSNLLMNLELYNGEKIDLTTIEFEILNDELKKNNLKTFKLNKKDKKMIIDHYNYLLDLPHDQSDLKRIDEEIMDLNIPIDIILLMLSKIRINILASTEKASILARAVEIVGKNELKWRQSLLNH